MVWKPFRAKVPEEPIQEIKKELELPVIPAKKLVHEEKEQKEEGLTEEDVIKALTEQRNIILNHEARIQAQEAALFRLKALV